MACELNFEITAKLGIITLDRSSALNALSLDMVKELIRILEKNRAELDAIIIRGMGRAFCAGGDVRWLFAKKAQQLDFFRYEYYLNYLIKNYPKPYIALMNGITMGGGVGISLHGKYPIAAENFKFAMPETAIGFFPDIGASYFLARLGSFGMYLGLTGASLNASEALQLGLIKGVVRELDFENIIRDISQGFTYKKLNKYFIQSSTSSLEPATKLFAGDSLEQIIANLTIDNSAWAQKQLKILAAKSPFSLKTTFSQIKKAQGNTFAQCLQTDFTLAQNFMKSQDFYEGVRALLIDKDNCPNWQYKSLAQVPTKHISSFFENNGTNLDLKNC